LGGGFLWTELSVPEGTDPNVMMLGIGAVAAFLGILMTFYGFRVLIMTQRTKKG
jgi:hypothetical protein